MRACYDDKLPQTDPKCPKCGAKQARNEWGGTSSPPRYECGTHGDKQSNGCRIRELESENDRLRSKSEMRNAD